MDAIEEYNKRWIFFKEITGIAMQVHNKYHSGLMESAYEAAMKYLLEEKGYKVDRQVYLPIFWDNIQLDQNYRMDLVVNDNIIIELKAINYIDKSHRKQLKSYLNITHLKYGMLINFGTDNLYSEWYYRDPSTGEIERIKLL